MYKLKRVELTLFVPSIEDAAAWYQRVLGWRAHYDVFNAEGQCTFGSVMCRQTDDLPDPSLPMPGFNLSRTADKPGDAAFTAFIEVDDVDAVYAQVIEGGVTDAAVPKQELWGGKTFVLRDLNGFTLTFWQQVEQVSLETVRKRTEEARKP